MPAQYPFLHTICEGKTPADIKVYIRGEEKNQGDIVPRGYLTALSNGERILFTVRQRPIGAGESIANASNPLFARVMVNRIWQHHFGQGLVGTPTNFGQLGERPTHPELLDYLAARFVESGWSMKAMHREIMLSATYQLSTDMMRANLAQDPTTVCSGAPIFNSAWMSRRCAIRCWPFPANSTRQSEGRPVPLGDTNRRRTVYALSADEARCGACAVRFSEPERYQRAAAGDGGPVAAALFHEYSFVAQQAKASRTGLRRRRRCGSDYSGLSAVFGREPNDRRSDWDGFVSESRSGVAAVCSSTC